LYDAIEPIVTSTTASLLNQYTHVQSVSSADVSASVEFVTLAIQT